MKKHGNQSTNSEKEEHKNPGFYCRDFIETHGNVIGPLLSCNEQCDECVNAIIEHHRNKKSSITEK
jgi:hypothetical protein